MLFDTPEKYQEMVKGYYRLIYGVDEVVMKILDELKKLKFDDNTIIVLSSDNGFFLGERGLSHKWFMYEESIRTPLIIYDPRLPENLRGKRINEMTLNIDIAPTILDLVGLNIADSMQGQSVKGLIYGEMKSLRQDFFYEHLFNHPLIPKSEGVRNERWKYIRYIEQKPVYEELYDLKNDPFEEHNIVMNKENKGILDSLIKRWSEFREILK
jgi:arylsulfatase A-like enzyme